MHAILEKEEGEGAEEMSTVNIVQCDQCGKRAEDVIADGWILVQSICSGAHTALRSNQWDVGNALARSRVQVKIRGGSRDFESADLCSPECAGAFLFGKKKEQT